MVHQVLGSASFGVASITRKHKALSGWYYLLDHPLGQKRHLKVSQSKPLGHSRNSLIQEQSTLCLNTQSISMLDINENPQKQRPIKPATRYPFRPIQDSQSTPLLLSPIFAPDDHNQNAIGSMSLCDLTSSPGDGLLRRKPFHGRFGNAEPFQVKLYEELNESADSTLSERDLCNTTLQEEKDTSLQWTIDTLDNESLLRGDDSEKLKRVEQECWQIVEELNQNNSWESSIATVTTAETPSFTDLSSCSSSESATNHLEALIRAEYDFLTRMQAGVQCYSRPLRYCMLSPEEHDSLFQNGEKIMAIAEFHLKKLTDNFQRNPSEIPSVVTAIYTPHILLMAEAYDKYLRGLPAAKSLLNELLTENAFQRFILKSTTVSEAISIDEFLETPAKHLGAVVAILEQINNDNDRATDAVENKALQQILTGEIATRNERFQFEDVHRQT